jgi:NAD(P)-dependent dehydrogenase (short-subunit alcohol dehydrogenase family)
MSERLAGKRAIVTGGSTGIGEELVRRFVAEGARVVFCARSEPESPAVHEEALFLRCDVTRPEQVDRFVEEAVGHLGGLDILVNNAGGATGFSQWPEQPDAEWGGTLDLNLGGTLHCCRAAWPHLEQSPAASIVMISSLSAAMAIGRSQLEAMGGAQPPASYQASKAAIDGLMVHLAGRGGQCGIRVNSVRPGRILTDKMRTIFGGDEEQALFWNHYRDLQILSRHGRAEDVAHAVVFLASDESSFITGQVLKVDGGAIAHL